MSAMGDKEVNRRSDKKMREGQRQRWADRQNGNGQADWANVDSSLLQGAIQRVAARGGALRFGYTSDGGAYAVGIYGDGEPYTEYIRPGEDINGFLNYLIETW